MLSTGQIDIGVLLVGHGSSEQSVTPNMQLMMEATTMNHTRQAVRYSLDCLYPTFPYLREFSSRFTRELNFGFVYTRGFSRRNVYSGLFGSG
jgi:hypothetical protein